MKKKVMLTFDTGILEALDVYAEDNFMGNRSMAVHRILQQFFKEVK